MNKNNKRLPRFSRTVTFLSKFGTSVLLIRFNFAVAPSYLPTTTIKIIKLRTVKNEIISSAGRNETTAILK